MQFWIIQGLNSLSLGGLLFLLSSGFSLIFGLMRLANLTHGAFFMLGTYFGATALRSYQRAEYLGDRARRRNCSRCHRRPVRTAGADPAENQSARSGAGHARHVLHHFRCLPGAVGRRFDSGADAAKPAGADAGVRLRVSDLSAGSGGMRHCRGDRAVFPAGADAARRDDPRRRRRPPDGARGRHSRLEPVHDRVLPGRGNCRRRRRAGWTRSFRPIRGSMPTCCRWR